MVRWNETFITGFIINFHNFHNFHNETFIINFHTEFWFSEHTLVTYLPFLRQIVTSKNESEPIFFCSTVKKLENLKL